MASFVENINILAGVSSELENINNNINSVVTVYNNIDDVNTVATNISDVVIVGNDLSNDYSYIEDNGQIVDSVTSGSVGTSAIITVSDNINDISIVSGISNNITSVANNYANINTVSSNISDINIVANDIDSIIAVSNISDNIDDIINISSEIVNVSNNVADVLVVSQDIASIVTVSGSIDDIVTTSESISNINTIAVIQSDITAVANIDSYVIDVASSISEVAAVGANIANVNAVSTNLVDISTVATSISDVVTVATDILDVSTVSSNISAVGTVANGISDVGIVSTNIVDVSTVSNISTDISTVAGIDSDVTTVAGLSSDIGIVADSITNVDLVGGSITSVNTVSGSISNVNTVSSNISNVNTVAGVSSSVTTVADNISSVNTASTNISSINTVAGNNANINTVSGNNSNITTVAGISGNITTVAGISTDVTYLATHWNDKVSTVTSTDNAIVRFDGTSGQVQDSSVTITDTGSLGIGGEPTAQIAGNAHYAKIGIWQDGGSTFYPVFGAGKSSSDSANAGAVTFLARTRGSKASPSIVQNGDILGSIVGLGFDGTDFGLGARIDFVSSGTPSSAAMPTDIVFKTSPSDTQTPVERIRINSAGTVSGITATMVGLGNVTNESKETMFTSPTFTGTVSGVTATMVGLGNVTNNAQVKAITSTANKLVKFSDTSSTITDSVIYDDGTNIGIGTTSPGNTAGYTTIDLNNATNGGIFTIKQNGAKKLTMYANGSSGYLGTTAAIPLQFGVSSGANITIGSSGNVGMGTSNPSYQLHLSSDSAAKPSTNTWTISSDERLKENIELANLDRCYEIVKTIPLKRYTWKDSVYTEEQVSDRSKLGWIAQDVQTVFPKAVNVNDFTLQTKHLEIDEEGIEQEVNDILEDCLDLNSDQIYAVMYGAIQKLQLKIEELEAKIDKG